MKTEQLELQDLTRAHELIDLVGARVRTLHAAQRVTDRAASRAIAANAEAYERRHEALTVYRALTTAYADNAGVDKGLTLTDAIAAAEQLLAERDVEDTAAL